LAALSLGVERGVVSEESSDNPLEESIGDELSAYDDVAYKVRSIASLIPWLDEDREEAEVRKQPNYLRF